MTIKVMLVDDEPYIRLILRKVIEKQEDFQVVSECDNMADALIQFNQNKPDVVFMDIEIKGASGIDCAKVISELEPQTKIIFATAHSEYMSNAFELYAFDYLVKPFDIERIEHSLHRIRTQMNSIMPAREHANEKNEYMKESNIHTNSNQEQTSVNQDQTDVNQDQTDVNQDHADVNQDQANTIAKGSKAGKDKLILKGKESMNFIDMDEIVLIERVNNSTLIYTCTGDSYQSSISMAELENKLNPNVFMRSHKSYIINLKKIKSVEPYGRWTYVVKLKGIQQDALLTRERFEQIKQLFG